MRIYESIFVLQPDLNDTQVDGGIDKVKKIIERFGGEILKIEKWGKKRLAYQIKKYKYGNYVLIYFNGKPEILSDLDRHCKLAEDIIRHLTLKTRKGFKVEAAPSPPVEVAQEEGALRGEKVEEGV